MTHPMEPLVLDQDSARERGRAHGEHWRDDIAALTEIRRDLMLSRGRCRSMAQAEALAALHLPVLAQHFSSLHEELLGIADGAGQSPEDILILNDYTDLRDVPPTVLRPDEADAPPSEPGDPGGCTAIYFNTLRGPVLGQTWDMHATAEPFVRMLRVRPRGTDEDTIVFTLTGCLGMTGIGQSGVGVTINNLSSTDGRVGVAWPALVRAMIAAPSAIEARARLDATPLSSGRHYMIADGTDFYGIECSGELKVLTQVGPKAAHLHTNHCFDPVLRQREAVARSSTTFARINMATTLYAQQRPTSAAALWDLLGSHDGRPRSICSHQNEIEDDPHASKTCGRIVMELATGEVMVGRGCSDDGDALHLTVERLG